MSVKVVLTGGGSGGHIMPILAVAAELKKLEPKAQVVYIGQRGDNLGDIPARDPNIDQVFAVRAGKLRRYHGEGWRQLLDLKTQAKNLRDALWTAMGIWQSFWLMRQLKPDVIFTRGGFVSVPVALGGRLAGVPYITHDSDSIPSLANRLITRWAALHAVALPEEAYPYPRAKTKMVGVPVSSNYELVTPRLMRHYRKLLGLDTYEQVLLVTGGGNGARQLNRAVVANVPYLLKRYPKLVILHIAGRSLEAETNQLYDDNVSEEARGRVRVEGFVHDLYRYSGAADVVVARGGATNLAEFAIQGKACVIIASKQLVWNVRNAAVMARHEAIVNMTEGQSEQELRLAMVLSELLDDTDKRAALGAKLQLLSHPGSARELAMLLLELVSTKR